MMLRIEDAKPGMELARDVINLNQSVLLTGGTILNAQHLRTLKMWGIDSIHIQGQEPDDAKSNREPALPPHLLQAIEEHFNDRLKFLAKDTPGIGQLRHLAIMRKAARPESQSVRKEKSLE
jgi:hypothetical protein